MTGWRMFWFVLITSSAIVFALNYRRTGEII